MKSLLWFYPLLPLLPGVSAVFDELPGSVGLDIDSCSIKAWVRAPDLDPGRIIPGQVRIQAEGPCGPILEYSLILRFKERVWIKFINPDTVVPEKPPRRFYNISSNEETSVFWNQHDLFSDNPSWIDYTKEMSNQTLWTVAEEERMVFESRYKLSDGSSSKDPLIRDFALLVPTTNYPPSERIFGRSIFTEPISERGNEHIYIYTVEAKFLNGTTIEVPAGYSAFNTLGPNPLALDDAPEVVPFRANFTETSFSSTSPSNPLNFSIDINVTFPRGRNLEQGVGTNHSLTFTLGDNPRTIDVFKNYNLTLTPPDISLHASSQERRMERLSSVRNLSIASATSTRCQLSPTSTEDEGFTCFGNRWAHGVVRSNWNTTTSAYINITQAAFPSIDMYYQSSEAEIHMWLSIQHEMWDEDDAFDEDYYWTPATHWMQPSKERKLFTPFHTKIPITIHPKAKQDFHVTHYLSPDARHPVFVDPSTASELLDLSVEERDLLAPMSTPIFKKITADIVRERYYQKSLHYVGDTWERKVLNGGSNLRVAQRGNEIKINPLLVQVA